MSKRAIVTGGAGFVGSHLCERLLNENYSVICVDNLYTGSLKNIEHLIKNSKFEFLMHDITHILNIECDEIYNLACPASPTHYQKDPIKTCKTSIYGSINMLEMALTSGAKILQASTSEVYGDPKVSPQVEKYWGNVNPVGVRSCYDEGKRAAETFFMDYYRQYGLPVKILRIFNTYGPKMSAGDGRVVSNFIVQALNGDDITIYGNGKQTRSFCYVDDLVDAMIKLMRTVDSFTGPVNIGNPFEITIYELAETIVKLTGSNSKIVYCDLPEDDPCRRKPDISLAKVKLSWEPKVSLLEGLQKTIDYFMRLEETF